MLAGTIPTHADEPISQKYIVNFKSNIDYALLSSVNATIVHKFKNINAVTVRMTQDTENKLKDNPEIKSIEEDKNVYLNGQLTNWGMQTIKTQVYKGNGYTGRGIKIAVIDTGVGPNDYLNVAGGVSFVPYTSSFNDDNGHGTHVAGIIAANDPVDGVVGVAPDASIYAVKVLDQNGEGDVSTIVSGIDWAITNKMDVINLSLGAEGDSPALKSIVDKAYKSGILIAAAAGNEGDIDPTADSVDYPAKYSSVIAVAATDQNNLHPSFSSTGSEVEIAAPGVDILSTYLNNQFAEASGTSMATGFVSGYLALLKQRFPNDSATDIRGFIQRSALDLGPQGHDNLYGYGLLQEHLTNVSRLSGKDRFEVAINVANKGWTTANTVFLSNYLAFADALSSGPLAYKMNAPILLTYKDQLPANIKNELIKLHAANVVIVGGTGSVSDSVVSELNNLHITVKRIAGKDRFEVSENVAKELGASDKIVIANGLKFPDALCIAPYAATKGYPILLTEDNEIPDEIKSYIQDSAAQDTIVVGGEGSIDNSELVDFPNPTRISGTDRFEVASNIVNKFYTSPSTVFVSTGLSFADALTGSVLAAKSQAPMLLTMPDYLPSSEDPINNGQIKHTTILGGTGSVDDSVFRKLLN